MRPGNSIDAGLDQQPPARGHRLLGHRAAIPHEPTFASFSPPRSAAALAVYVLIAVIIVTLAFATLAMLSARDESHIIAPNASLFTRSPEVA